MVRNRHFGYAEIAATLALVISLSGTAIAVVRLPRNSVTAREIATGGVRTEEIANGEVKGVDLAPGIQNALISLIHAATEEGVQIQVGATFQNILSRQLPRAGDEGLRLVEGNVEATNPNSTAITFGVRVLDTATGQRVATSTTTIAPGETLSIPIDGTVGNVEETTLTLQAQTIDGPSATVDRGSFSVTTSARRNH